MKGSQKFLELLSCFLDHVQNYSFIATSPAIMNTYMEYNCSKIETDTAYKRYEFIPPSMNQGSKERLSSLPRADAKPTGGAKPAKPINPQNEKENNQQQKNTKVKPNVVCYVKHVILVHLR